MRIADKTLESRWMIALVAAVAFATGGALARRAVQDVIVDLGIATGGSLVAAISCEDDVSTEVGADIVVRSWSDFSNCRLFRVRVYGFDGELALDETVDRGEPGTRE